MKLSEIVPEKTDRAFLVGQTGSGKTTLAQYLLNWREFVIVYDTKRRVDWPDYKVVRRLRDLETIDPIEDKRVIYRPAFDELETADGDYSPCVNAFFKWVYERENTTLYVDEMTLIANVRYSPFYYRACYQQGREKGIEVMSGTQRPSGVPQFIKSEAEHFYCFYLKMPYDRVSVEQATGIPTEAIAALSKREFIYAPQGGGQIGPLKLDLTTGARSATDALEGARTPILQT